jgi:hypothetical protein
MTPVTHKRILLHLSLRSPSRYRFHDVGHIIGDLKLLAYLKKVVRQVVLREAIGLPRQLISLPPYSSAD